MNITQVFHVDHFKQLNQRVVIGSPDVYEAAWKNKLTESLLCKMLLAEISLGGIFPLSKPCILLLG